MSPTLKYAVYVMSFKCEREMSSPKAVFLNRWATARYRAWALVLQKIYLLGATA
jgi:hypothetical protein